MSTKDKNQMPKVRIKHFIGDSSYAYDYAVYERSINMFEVLIDGKLGFANKEGELVIPCIYSPRFDAKGNLIPYKGNKEYIFIHENGRVGAIRKDGHLALKFEWKDIIHWRSHIVAVAQKTNLYNLWGFVNLQTGKMICEPRFSFICVLSEDLIAVREPAKRRYALFSLAKGALLTEYKYDELNPFVDSYAPVRIADKWGLIEKSGKEVIKPKYNKQFNFDGDFAIVEKTYCKIPIRNGNSIKWPVEIKKVLINKDGLELVNSSDSKWTSIRRLSNNLFSLKSIKNGQIISSLRQYLKHGENNIIIKDAHYIYINFVNLKDNSCKLYHEEITPESYQNPVKVIEHLNYQNSNLYYIDEGNFAMQDRNGKDIFISSKQLACIKNDLINNTEKELERFGVKLETIND